MAKIKVGDSFFNKKGRKYVVIDYHAYSKILVRFVDTGYEKWSAGKEIKNGSIKDPNSPTVCLVGIVGVGATCVSHPVAYECWRGMLRRCYVEKNNKDWKHYGSKGAFVNKVWHNFQNFLEWYLVNYKEGFELDKDILDQGNLEYSPEKCTMVPQALNKLLTFSNSTRLGSGRKVGVHSREGSEGWYISLSADHFADGHAKVEYGFSSKRVAYKRYCYLRTNAIRSAADKYYKEGIISLKVKESLYDFKVEDVL